jgi:Zn-dependent peptidase ImmA (M78 family)/DNA-binding XRE family transcriptional regulator
MERIPVEPAVLLWARKSAGLHQVDTAAKKLSISQKSLESWETGELQPTIKQLRQMSKVYKRPLAVLLLPAPPKDFEALRDFRRTAGTGEASTWSPALESEFRRAVSQREVYLELADVAPGFVPISELTFRIHRRAEIDAASEQLRDVLGMAAWPASIWSKPRELLNQVIGSIEELGILVIHTRDVDIEEMRGFSISHWPFPVIALNGSDTYRPRVFTLLHELVHLGLQAGGLCDLHELTGRKERATDAIERFCNQVAAAVLMPRASLLADPVVARASSTYRWSLDELKALSDRFGASSEAVLIRLIDLGKADWDLYRQRKIELDQRYLEFRLDQKRQRREQEGGPSYYTVKARDLGHRYIGSVLEAYHGRFISSLDVADYLSVRYEQLPKLQEALRR